MKKTTSPVPTNEIRRLMQRLGSGKVTEDKALEFFLRELDLEPDRKGVGVVQHFLYYAFHNHREVFYEYLKTYKEMSDV